MSFGNSRSYKRSNLRLRKELEELTRKSQLQYVELSAQEKSQLLKKKFSQGNKTNLKEFKTKAPKQKNDLNEEKYPLHGEILPPSPSVALEPALFEEEDVETLKMSEKGDERLEFDGVRTSLQNTPTNISKAPAVASIRANVDLSVVMQGTGIVDGERMSKASTVRSTADRVASSNLNPTVQQIVKKCPEQAIKPSIINSQGTSMQMQLNRRPTPSQDKYVPSSKASAKVKTSKNPSQTQTPDLANQSDFRDNDGENEKEIEELYKFDDEAKILHKNARTESAKSAYQSESEYDKIHTEIQALTLKLSSEINIADILKSNEKPGKDQEQDSPAAETQRPLAGSLSTYIRTDEIGANDFAVKGSSPILSPRLPAASSASQHFKEAIAIPSQASRASGNRADEQENLQTTKDEIAKQEDESNRDTGQPYSSVPMKKETERSFDSLPQENSLLMMTDYEALQVLEKPIEVSAEDIINVTGSPAKFFSPAPVNQETNDKRLQRETTFLVSWDAPEEEKVKAIASTFPPNIHHFCKMPAAVDLQPHLCQATRDTHTPDRFHHTRVKFADEKNMVQVELHAQGSNDEGNKLKEEIKDLDEKVKEKNEKNVVEKKLSHIAQRILEQAETGDTAETFDRLKEASDQLFAEEEDELLTIAGKKIELRDNSSRLYWTPAPPKMHLAPTSIQAHLFPEYQGGAMLKENLAAEHMAVTAPESDDDNQPSDELDPRDRQARNRILRRAHGSMTDLNKLAQDKKPGLDSEDEEGEEFSDVEREGETPTRFESVLDKRRYKAKQRDKDRPEEKINDEEGEMAYIRRAKSQPLLYEEENLLSLSSGYDVSMQELSYQQSKLETIKATMAAEEEARKLIEEEQEAEIEDHKETSSPTSERKSVPVSIFTETTNQGPQRRDVEHSGDTETFPGTSTATASAVTGVSKIVGLTKILKMKHLKKRIRKRKDPHRVKEIQKFLDEPPRIITRSHSFQSLRELEQPTKENLIEKEFPKGFQVEKVKSLTNLTTFEELVADCSEHNHKTEEEKYDWVREQYWYVWFDEIYPPSDAPPDLRYDLFSSMSTKPARSKSKTSSVVDNAILDDIQVIEPEISADNKELYQALEMEIKRLDDLIDETDKQETLAIHLCRRGAVYRKLGQLKTSWDDLNRAIDIEPMLLDAYWHRHLLQLLQSNRKAALEDLTFIIKHNSTSARAFRSRAELYRMEGDATMAIVNYSQAIKLNPDDGDTYYQRAAMFEKRGDMILALDDYRATFKLMPSKTEAICRIGVYHFENKNWVATINDFTEMLQQDPRSSKAYTYRARAFAKLGKFEEALSDLSAAVHYDPSNAVAFYHRGCLLRKIHSRQALQDLSVSLLLDNSFSNVSAYLHRGILYTDLKRWEDAIPDFQAALRLDRNLASAHVNIGLICITRYGDYHKAIRRYTAAIIVNPTYIRAYICRAEAYHKLKMLQEAVLDYTRAIHLRPDIADYHMARGKLLLEQNKLDLASFHVRQAAELNQGLGASATQQAVVQSFLKNFDQAVDTLERATRVNPVAPLFILLGKTHMKSKKFKDAINAFKKALKIMTPWDAKVEMPVAAASVYFLVGTCHGELGNHLAAQEAFNSAIKVNPQYAEGFYQRGLTKMKLNYTKGIHDFNRALAINPTLFQAFLSRAAYYGMKGRYSKGIMSCNEAIKLQPKSVRAFLYRGALKYHIKAYSLAVKDLTEAVAIDCTCALAYFNRAVCYHEMKYYQKALMDYGTVMLLENTPNLKVLQNRGLLYLQVDDVENALQDFLAAAKVSGNDHRIRHTLGLCYHRLNQLEKAVASYNGALRIDPFFVEAYNGRGNALMDYGHQEGNLYGRRDYLKALHISPVCLSARVNLAYNLQVDGCFQAAWDQFSAAITIDSGCQAALEGRAVVNLQMRNTFGAFVDMNAAIKISKTAELLTNRGVVQQFMGDFVNAVRDYQAAIKLDPSYALAYYNAANVYFRQRMFQQALAYYNKVISWTPNDESAILNRAITKVMMKDFKGALHDFNQAATLNPYAAHVYFNRANLFASLRKYKEAEEDYTRALSLNPGDALVYKRRADVLGKMSKREAAIFDYKKAIIIQTRRRQLQPGLS